jgi:hypothetical protein
MDLLQKIFNYIFAKVINLLDISTNSLDELESVATFSANVHNFLAWARTLLPINVIGILLGLTGMYYACRFVWALIRLIRSSISNVNIFSQFFK